MRSVGLTATGKPVLAASAALLLVTLVGCSSNRGSPGVTTVVFDGKTYTINGNVSCANQADGTLLINAADGAKKTDPRANWSKESPSRRVSWLPLYGRQRFHQ
jgi:hypothetical protein